MFTRALIWLSFALMWLAGTFLGSATAALRTDAGRQAVVHAASSTLNEAINGSFRVETVGGTFLSGLEVWDAEMRGPDGELFALVPHLQLNYSLRTLFSRRFVLGELTIDDLTLSLIQVEPGGSFNVDLIFAGDSASPESGEGVKPYLAFRDVEIRNATVIVRTPDDSTNPSVVDGERIATRFYRVRRFERIDARFPYVRLLSPLPGEEPMALDVASLMVRVNDPAFRLIGAQGTAEIWRDSVILDLTAASLPASTAALKGTLFWPTGPMQVDIRAVAPELSTDDLLGLVRTIPRGLTGSASVQVRSLSEDALVMDAENLDLEGLGGGGRARGRLAMQFGPGDTWAQRQTDLTLTNFDLEYVRHLLDTLPVAGRVTGRVSANGPREAMALQLDATFRDSLVTGRPSTYIRSRGVVALGVPGEFVFHDYRLDSADVSLATVRRLIPAIQLVGRLRGAGALDGEWLRSQYDGRLRHRDGVGPETVATGTIRFDATGQAVGLWGQIVFDSLRLVGLQSSFPQLSASAVLHGPLSVAGYLDSLEIEAQLRGPDGRASLSGPFVFDSVRTGARAFALELEELDATAYRAGLLPTRLTGAIRGRGWRTESESVLDVVLDLGASQLRGTEFDSIRGRAAVADSMITFDSLEVWGQGAYLTMTGAMGTAQPIRGRSRFSVSIDSLSTVEPWLAPILGDLEPEQPPARGTVRIFGEINGAADAFSVLADMRVSSVERGDLRMGSFGGAGTWVSSSGAVRVAGAVDTLSVGSFPLSDLTLAVQGVRDSLDWRVRTRVQEEGDWMANGRLVINSSGFQLSLDSLQGRLPQSTWAVTSASMTVTDSAAVVTGFEARNSAGAGRLLIDGRLPFKGSGALRASVEALPLDDIWVLLGRDHRDVAGQLSGTFILRGTATRPVIDGSVLLTDGVIGTFNAPSTTGVLHYENQQITGDVELRRGGSPILRVDVAVPYDLAVSPAGDRRLSGPLTITGRADSVDLSLFNTITPAVRRASGVFDAEVGIAGTWEQPLLTGSMVIRNGSAEFPSLGARHEQINGRLELVGDTIHVRQLSLNSGIGQARIGGYVRLEELSKPILDLTAVGDDFLVMNVRGFLSLSATANVRLRGPVFGSTLTGSATATRGIVYFADLITKDVVNLEDPLFRAFVDTTMLREEGLGAAFENRFLDSLRIDSLDVRIGREVWLRSNEANIQLTGGVTVDKVRDQYRLNGALQTPRGNYRLDLVETVSRDFAVTRGEVQYFGTPDLNADLDIEAQHVVRVRGREDVNILITIGGTLYQPRLTLSSDISPPLSDAEIMSYLLFGGSAADASQARAAQVVGEELSNVLSGQISTFFVSNLDVPLDYFQIRPAGSGGFQSGAEVAVGKEFRVLGRSAFLTAAPRLCPRLASRPVDISGSLEFRFSQRWLLVASAEPGRSCDFFTAPTDDIRYQLGLDLIWEMSY